MISVCITTYNGGKYIKEQIESILSQISENDEIIISDDGSKDNTLSILQSFNDKRIKIFLHEKDQRKKHIFKFDLTTKNMENAIKKSLGEFIFMADQDDIWEENRINSVLSFLDIYSLVINDCKVIDENQNVIYESYFDLINSKNGFLKNLNKNSYLGCCMAFKRDTLQYILPFPKQPVPHDIWIGLISEIFGKVYFLREKKILYRRHNNNLSNSAEVSSNSLVFKIRYRAILLNSIVLRIIKQYKRLLFIF
ncbi:MAG: glycosyltransferase [Flavobacterium sp.]